MSSLRWPELACALAICFASGATLPGHAAEPSSPEDLVPKKIQALQYLVTVSCFCPDHPDQVKDALSAALDDDAEVVRYEAAVAVARAARRVCPVCKRCSFCVAEVMDKLEQIGIGQNAQGGWQEPSERVRTAAYEALTACRRRLESTRESVADEPPTAPLPPDDLPARTVKAPATPPAVVPSVAGDAHREPQLLATTAPPAAAQKPEPAAVASAGYAQSTDLPIAQQRSVAARPPRPLTMPLICWEQDARQSAPILRVRKFTAPVND
jgi:hypothetical protein